MLRHLSRTINIGDMWSQNFKNVSLFPFPKSLSGKTDHRWPLILTLFNIRTQRVIKIIRAVLEISKMIKSKPLLLMNGEGGWEGNKVNPSGTGPKTP